VEIASRLDLGAIVVPGQGDLVEPVRRGIPISDGDG
jgi:hypothetical protein